MFPKVVMWMLSVIIAMYLSTERVYCLNGQTLSDEYKMTNVPDFNFCIYSTDVVRLVTDCTLSFLPKDYTEEFRTTLSELFGGLSLSECLRIICQNNNYDGFMLLQNWIEELDKNLQPTARFVGWNCVEKYEHLYARDIA